MVRTNPNFVLCKSDEYRQVMNTILFIYARQHPTMAYKQGMHEILAVLLTIQFGE